MEQIIEEIALRKFEEMAEIKAIIKKIDPSETEAIAEQQSELEKVKQRMEKQKV